MGLSQRIESDDAAVAQTGVWAAHDTSYASGGRYLYSSGNLEDALTLTFTGAQVDRIYVTHPALGVFVIEVDGPPSAIGGQRRRHRVRGAGVRPCSSAEYVHLRRTISRCHRKTVSGWTIRIASRNCWTECPVAFFSLTLITASVKHSARDKRTGLSNCCSTIANCLRSTRISRSFSWSDKRPIRINSSSVENICITTDQTIHPRFQLAGQGPILPAHATVDLTPFSP
jgi:hypothetical protein